MSTQAQHINAGLQAQLLSAITRIYAVLTQLRQLNHEQGLVTCQDHIEVLTCRNAQPIVRISWTLWTANAFRTCRNVWRYVMLRIAYHVASQDSHFRFCPGGGGVSPNNRPFLSVRAPSPKKLPSEWPALGLKFLSAPVDAFLKNDIAMCRC